jgi:hypothetical protein
LCAWRKKYLRMTVSEAKRLKALEEENRRLKPAVAGVQFVAGQCRSEGRMAVGRFERTLSKLGGHVTGR